MSAEPMEKGVQPLEIDEINVDQIKLELKEEVQGQQDAEVTEKEMNIMCHISSIQCQSPKMMLMRQSSHDFTIVSDLYSLLEDFKIMACSRKSLLCCQPAGCHALLMCELCGEHFVGQTDRMYKLCKHFEKKHPFDALQLVLGAMKRYTKLLEHMRKALEFDEWFGILNYTPIKRTKSFQCTKCNFKHK